MSADPVNAPLGGDIRNRLGSLLDSIPDETLKELIQDMLDANKLRWALYTPEPCKKCGDKPYPKKVPVDYPDLDKRAKILNILLDQGKGKPKETKAVEVTTKTRLEDMTDAELEAFARGG